MRHVRLRYCEDTEPGIRRRGRTRFRYEWTSGKPVRDKKTLARIRSLAVPPAWTDVWICADARGHLQATGRDARGRKQYRYHPIFREQQEQSKFEELAPFGHALGDVRKHVDRDLARPGLPPERVIALVVALLDRTHLRIGNEEYAAENGSYGLTTLRRKHVAVDSGVLHLRFQGKAGKRFDVECDDPRICKLVRTCQDLPGQVLFKYEEGDDELKPVTSNDVNDYLRDITGLDSTAKTFRTWGATVMTAAGLVARSELDPDTNPRTIAKEVVGDVAAQLGNTPTVCRKSYIHPVILDRYNEGDLVERWDAGPARQGHGLSVEERKTLHVIEAS